jgi:hypothetical protein
LSVQEVINDDATTACAPYVKATTRDMRQYISSKGYRKIPVGYSAADVSENRMEMAHYMNCGTDDERSDFFAFNDYSWCDPSSLYSTDMTGVYSGGLVYQYSEEGAGFGIVKVKDSSSVQELAGFTYLQKALAGTTPPSGDGGYDSSAGKASDCPAKSSNWNVTTTDLPAIPKKALEVRLSLLSFQFHKANCYST